MSYSSRKANFRNKTAVDLLTIIDQKNSNLCVSADVVKKEDLLTIADILGPFICCLKTHIDIIDDFDHHLILQLTAIAKNHNFLIFEDRKFADIGNTVKLQYSSGIYKIADWSHITNAHPIPGEGIIKGLKEVGLGLGRGLLLLAEMSTKGNLATQEYKMATLKMAVENRDFVFGFIGQTRLPCEEDFLYLTPGVNLDTKGDGLGQQYRTPRQVILEEGLDVIIVGRGIYGSMDPKIMVEKAKEYQKAAWDAYLERIAK